MLDRDGVTSIRWLSDIGVLGRKVILGHAFVIRGSSWSNCPAGDIEVMADAGCVVEGGRALGADELSPQTFPPGAICDR